MTLIRAASRDDKALAHGIAQCNMKGFKSGHLNITPELV